MRKLLSYFSFQGRSNRQRYWMTALALLGILMVAGILVAALAEASPLIGWIVLPVVIAYFWAICANAARRLHDRNKSSWWLLLFLGVPAFFSLFGAIGAAGGGPKEGADFISALGLPFSIWGLVEMGFLRGSKGPNKYGDDPLQPAMAEVFA